MGEIVNLRRLRKGRQRRRDEAEAAENRVLFGMTKAERRRIESEREKDERRLDALKLAGPDDA